MRRRKSDVDNTLELYEHMFEEIYKRLDDMCVGEPDHVNLHCREIISSWDSSYFRDYLTRYTTVRVSLNLNNLVSITSRKIRHTPSPNNIVLKSLLLCKRKFRKKEFSKLHSALVSIADKWNSYSSTVQNRIAIDLCGGYSVEKFQNIIDALYDYQFVGSSLATNKDFLALFNN